MTRPCTTCVHYDIDPLAVAPICDVSLTFAQVERVRTHRTACGPDGRWWEARQALPGPAGPAGGDFKQEVGVMPFDTTNGLDGLGTDAGAWTFYSAPLSLPEMRASPWQVVLNIALAVLAWAVLFGLGVGCVWIGWALAMWMGV